MLQYKPLFKVKHAADFQLSGMFESVYNWQIKQANSSPRANTKHFKLSRRIPSQTRFQLECPGFLSVVLSVDLMSMFVVFNTILKPSLDNRSTTLNLNDPGSKNLLNSLRKHFVSQQAIIHHKIPPSPL